MAPLQLSPWLFCMCDMFVKCSKISYKWILVIGLNNDKPQHIYLNLT